MKRIVFIFLICQFATAKLTAQFFTKQTSGPIVTAAGDSRSVNWIDMNNDGFVDCMITNGPAGGQNNSVYINNQTGGFTALVTDTIVKDHKPSDGATWADTDNDGNIDCFVVNWYNADNLFYANYPAGNFTRVSTGPLVNDGGYSETASWGDYDNDGFVDLYVTNSAGPKNNFLYHNTGQGAFTKIVSGAPVTDTNISRCVNWVDIDNDRDADLFITNEENQNEDLYRNDGNGNFVKLTAGTLLNNGGKTMSGSWGDYDNDGDLDVFLANDSGNNALFRNDGNFNFTKISGDTVSRSSAYSFSSAWSDVDNDGDLDLFVTNSFSTLTKQLNFFYLNNGNGSFTRNSSDIVGRDSAWCYGCAFGDYDNDGFEDLAVATTRFHGIDPGDFLYHNNGNSNHWITIQLTGTTANRSAIGCRVRVRAIINGNAVWQLREISAQSSYCGQNDLRAHFGLGNATMVDSIKVEWRTGTDEVFTIIPANQFISIVQGAGVTSIRENISDDHLIVYPNPADNAITVQWKGSRFAPGDKLVLSDVSGKKIMEQLISSYSTEATLHLKDTVKHRLSGTTCLLTVFYSGKTLTKKVMIE